MQGFQTTLLNQIPQTLYKYKGMTAHINSLIFCIIFTTKRKNKPEEREEHIQDLTAASSSRNVAIRALLDISISDKSLFIQSSREHLLCNKLNILRIFLLSLILELRESISTSSKSVWFFILRIVFGGAWGKLFFTNSFLIWKMPYSPITKTEYHIQETHSCLFLLFHTETTEQARTKKNGIEEKRRYSLTNITPRNH